MAIYDFGVDFNSAGDVSNVSANVNTSSTPTVTPAIATATSSAASLVPLLLIVGIIWLLVKVVRRG